MTGRKHENCPRCGMRSNKLTIVSVTDSELTEFILEGKVHPIRRCFGYWFVTQARFKDFAYEYREKIRSKVRRCAEHYEKLEDVRYELEIAYLLLLNDWFRVRYEAYDRRNRAPDFSVSIENSIDFNVEVKRLRVAALGQRYYDWLDRVNKKLRALPPGFLVSFHMPPRDDLDSVTDREKAVEENKLVDRLEASEDAVLQFIEATIRSQENNLFSGVKWFPIPGFERELELGLSSETPLSPTFLVFCMDPPFYKYNEDLKLCDLICMSLGQMVPAMVNILMIRSTSSTHDKGHVAEAIDLMRKRACEGGDEFFRKRGLDGADDYVTKMKNVSAVWFRSNSFSSRDGFVEEEERTLLWSNDGAAEQMPESLKTYFITLPVPYPRF